MRRVWNAAPPRDTYIIARLDHVTVPTALAYVGHGETPHDLVLRFTHFRDSATRWSNRRDAISEARRLAPIFNSYHFKVNGFASQHTFWESK